MQVEVLDERWFEWRIAKRETFQVYASAELIAIHVCRYGRLLALLFDVSRIVQDVLDALHLRLHFLNRLAKAYHLVHWRHERGKKAVNAKRTPGVKSPFTISQIPITSTMILASFVMAWGIVPTYSLTRVILAWIS